jgi:hypothetical protein
MTMVEEIDKALQAHRHWRAELKDAIKTRRFDRPIETIRADNMCPFGKWLTGLDIPADQKTSVNYKTIVALHTEFHQVAGEVAELVVTGKVAEAETIMDIDGKYLESSAKLSSALINWKRDVTLTAVS